MTTKRNLLPASPRRSLHRTVRPPHLAGMTLDLTDDEARALAQLLRRTLDFDPYPHAPRLDPLKAIIEKIELSPPKPEPPPTLRPGYGADARAGRRRRRG
jgi:hypothetical protein